MHAELFYQKQIDFVTNIISFFTIPIKTLKLSKKNPTEIMWHFSCTSQKTGKRRGTMKDNQIISQNPFGLNITLPKKTIQEVQKVAQQEIENITVNPWAEYLEENDKVFSGEVAKEIRKYQAQIYALGQVMREGQPTSTFKANV